MKTFFFFFVKEPEINKTSVYLQSRWLCLLVVFSENTWSERVCVTRRVCSAAGELLSQPRPDSLTEIICPKNGSERVNVALVYPPTPTIMSPKWSPISHLPSTPKHTHKHRTQLVPPESPSSAPLQPRQHSFSLTAVNHLTDGKSPELPAHIIIIIIQKTFFFHLQKENQRHVEAK